jgi:hypothetical protein
MPTTPAPIDYLNDPLADWEFELIRNAMGWGPLCNCLGQHSLTCRLTPIFYDTAIARGAFPPQDWGWLDFEWVWTYGHLCEGCGNPRYIGRHGMSEYGGCV